VNRKRVENDARAWVDGALASSAGTEEGVLRLVVDYRFGLFYKPSLEPEVLTTQKLDSLANHIRFRRVNELSVLADFSLISYSTRICSLSFFRVLGRDLGATSFLLSS
jgi:hypothetical protein